MNATSTPVAFCERCGMYHDVKDATEKGLRKAGWAVAQIDGELRLRCPMVRPTSKERN